MPEIPNINSEQFGDEPIDNEKISKFKKKILGLKSYFINFPDYFGNIRKKLNTAELIELTDNSDVQEKIKDIFFVYPKIADLFPIKNFEEFIKTPEAQDTIKKNYTSDLEWGHIENVIEVEKYILDLEEFKKSFKVINSAHFGIFRMINDNQTEKIPLILDYIGINKDYLNSGEVQRCASDKLLHILEYGSINPAEDVLKLKKILLLESLEKIDWQDKIKSLIKNCFSEDDSGKEETKEEREKKDIIAVGLNKEFNLEKEFLIEVLIEEVGKREKEDFQKLIEKAGFTYNDFINDSEVQTETKKRFLENLEKNNTIDNESLQENIPIQNFSEFQKTNEYKESALKGFTSEINSLHSIGIDPDEKQKDDYYEYASRLYDSLISLGYSSDEIFENSIKQLAPDFKENFSLAEVAEVFENIDSINFFEFKENPQTQNLAKSIFVRTLINGNSIDAEKIIEKFNINYNENKNEDWYEISKIHDIRNLKAEDELTDRNWIGFLSLYIRAENIDVMLPMNPKEEDKEQIKEAFRDPKNKEFALGKFRELWKNFLQSPDYNFDPKIIYLTSLISEFYAGELKYIEDLGLLINQISENIFAKTTTESTKKEIMQGLQKEEARFQKEKWTNDKKTLFYQISTDVLKAAPSLYTDFLRLFQKLDNKKMQEFQKELFPLYHAQIVLLQENDETENSSEVFYNPRELVEIRKNIKAFSESENLDFNKEKTRILEFLQNKFSQKFGLIKIPESFDQEKIRSLQNIIRYLGNINEKNSDKEEILALFLGLMINNEWENFRLGKEINLKEYFQEEKIEFLQEYLNKRKELNVLTAEKLGIKETDLALFQEKLQNETISMLSGNIQTIDQKLQNISQNIQELNDPDIYTEEESKIFKLLKTHGKIIGTVLSKTFQELSGKKIPFSTDERKIQEEINSVFKEKTLTSGLIKEFQNIASSLNPIISILQNIESQNLPEKFTKLNQLLQPSKEITKIFNRLGEEFTPTSGALALTQDLTYLETIMVKNEDKINLQEKIILQQYLDSIREQMQTLEKILEDIKTKFTGLKTKNIPNVRLKDRLNEIEKIIYQTDEKMEIISSIISNPNIIIENIRQCLGCLKKESNNDTNLSLMGDQNKFYVYSKTPVQKMNESIADEITFLEPIKYPNGNEEMSFVFDQVYGSKSSDILISHIAAVFKKYQDIKKTFPTIKLSLFITDSAMQSVGLDSDLLTKRLQELRDFNEKKYSLESIKDIIVNVAESASGEHYMEFGGDSRTAGERNVDGIVIKI